MTADRPVQDPVIHLDRLTLRYGQTLALDDVSLAVSAGGILGLIGPDGVGKSSLLALIAGARRLQQGHIEVLGGDVLRIAIAVEPDAEAERRRIIAIRFKAYGCAATIAVASVISEMVVGKRVADIDGIDNDDVVAALDGLPAGRIHAVVLGRAALREAIAQLS